MTLRTPHSELAGADVLLDEALQETFPASDPIACTPACDRIPMEPDDTEPTMKICPLHDRVVVRRQEQARRTAAGIVIPDTAAEKPDHGEVIAVGPGTRLEDGRRCEPDVKVGDRVLFGKYAGTPIKVEGEALLVMREADLLAVVTADSAP